MRNLRPVFTMRREAPPSKGDWFRIQRPQNAVAGEPKGDTTEVYIYDEIGYWGTSAQDFAQQLMSIDTDKIALHINSPGGEMFDGLAIYNALKTHKAEVTSYVDALAASAASFIALAGDKVVMARNSTMMIHDASAICWGNAEDMDNMSELLNNFSNNIADIYAQKGGGTADEWRALMKEETWYSASEAVTAGLADEMTDPDPEVDDPENKWDFSVFDHAGRGKAENPFRVRERVRVMNTAKETRMAESTPEVTPGGDPGTNQPESQDGQPDSNTEANTTPGSDNEARFESDTHTADEPTGDPTVDNRLVPTVVNGVTVQVPAALVNELSALRTFRQETIETSRRTFVENLARQNKIAATEIDRLSSWANTLDDNQYDTWATSMSSAPASAMFAQHGSTPGDTSAVTDTAVSDEIATLQGVVAAHRRAGMSEETLQTKQSFIRLQQLTSGN